MLGPHVTAGQGKVQHQYSWLAPLQLQSVISIVEICQTETLQGGMASVWSDLSVTYHFDLYIPSPAYQFYMQGWGFVVSHYDSWWLLYFSKDHVIQTGLPPGM